MKALNLLVSGILLASTLSSCAPASLATADAAGGGLLGGAAGTGVGYLIGRELGKKTENMLLAGAIGTGLGALGGAWFHDYRNASKQKRTIFVRQSRAIDENQKKLDALRNLQYENSIWGQKETKPYNERYWDSSDYEGGEFEGALSH
jgi:hypothetical protein